MINFTEEDKNKFWSKVDILSKDECWEWQAGINRDGYGNFYCGTTVSASRTAWEITNGPIPEGKLCLHKCDNRKCVNPNHLYIGNYSDNNSDRERRNPGSAGRCSSVGADGIAQIKKLRQSGMRYCDIAKLFPVSAEQISRICRGLSGNHTIEMNG